jgi:small subunit ribosomal protein S2
MIGLLKKLFGAKPAEQTAEAPYKAEAAPVDTADIAIAQLPEPAVAVVVVAEAVVPAAVVEQAPAKKPAPKKQQTAKKPAATKTATPKAPAKPKAKPVA